MWLPYDATRDLDVLAALKGEPSLIAALARGPGWLGAASVIAIPERVVELEGVNIVRDLRTCLSTPATGYRFVFAGYELGFPLVGLAPRSAPAGQPLGLVCECPAALVFHHDSQKVELTGVESIPGKRLRQAFESARARAPARTTVTFTPDVEDGEHMRRIEATLAHIGRGDIYQANVTRRLQLTGSLDTVDALVALSLHNPVPHGAFLRHRGFELASNSMETLLTFDAASRRAQSFPIKGTRARADDPRMDAARAEDLRADAKERAEHVMIVDLVRNDLGRVCVPGSVDVPELMATHGYRTVWHGVSTVQGTLSPAHDAADLFCALFPGGSITGAPKRRALQIIEALEQTPRGAYTGSLVMMNAQGDLAASILIRTLVRDARGVGLAVGGGIVEASRPERELAETWEKARVFMDVLGR